VEDATTGPSAAAEGTTSAGREGMQWITSTYLAETTSVPAAKSLSRWLRFDARMVTPGRQPAEEQRVGPCALTPRTRS
jgi:hypothetical protein